MTWPPPTATARVSRSPVTARGSGPGRGRSTVRRSPHDWWRSGSRRWVPLPSSWRPAGASPIDVGCGQGWSTIAVARAFPGADVLGIDSDAASIADARRASGGGSLRRGHDPGSAPRHGPTRRRVGGRLGGGGG
ncbi:MAG: class I SAM-dependent methyltransferase [Acidimicrobiales bacterium]